MLSLYVVVPLAAAVGLGWFVAIARFEALTERRMQEEIELVARALSVPLGHALDQGSAGQLTRSLQAAEGINRIYGAYVYDNAGDLIAAFGMPPQPAPGQISRIAADGDNTGAYGELAGRRIYSYFVPLADVGGRIAGVLEVTRRRRDFDDHFSELRVQAAAGLTAFTLFLVGLVMWRHHRTLGQHVERLASDMGRITQGDRTHRAQDGGFHEIRTLAAALNEMLDRIEQSQRQLDEQRQARGSLEARLHQSEKLAAIGGLSAGVAHELGTPLSVVYGRAQRLLRDASPGGRVVRDIEEIQDQVRRMEGIVRQLLEFGRGRAEPPRVSSAVEVIRSAVSSVAELARDSGVTVQVELPETPERMLMHQAGLEMAVRNLLRNAMHATPGGTVRVVTVTDGVHLRICVDDDGPGIPDAIRSRVCEPFFTTKPVGHGTGLGLALAHRAVADLGGRLEIGAGPLGGARLEILVPRMGVPDASGEEA